MELTESLEILFGRSVDLVICSNVVNPYFRRHLRTRRKNRSQTIAHFAQPKSPMTGARNGARNAAERRMPLPKYSPLPRWGALHNQRPKVLCTAIVIPAQAGIQRGVANGDASSIWPCDNNDIELRNGPSMGEG